MSEIKSVEKYAGNDGILSYYVRYTTGNVIEYKKAPKTVLKFMDKTGVQYTRTLSYGLVVYGYCLPTDEEHIADPKNEPTPEQSEDVSEPEPVCTACDFCVHYDCCKSNAPDCIVCRAGEDARENCDLSCRSCFTPYDVSESEPEPEPETAPETPAEPEDCACCSGCMHYFDCKENLRIIKRDDDSCFYSPCPVSLCCSDFQSARRFRDVSFADDEHKQMFLKVIGRMNLPLKYGDPHRESLAYLITLDKVCRKHIDDLYDFEERRIRPTALEKGWQTSTSRCTTMLSFNLFNGGTLWCPEDQKDYCTPANIFCCSYAPYYWQAVKLLYPDYCAE